MSEVESKVKEVVGVFNDNTKLQSAIFDLSSEGFGRHKFSIIASPESVKDQFDIENINISLIEDNKNTPRTTNIAPEEIGIAEGAIVGTSILAGAATALITAGSVAISALIPAAIVGSTAGATAGAVLAKKLGEKYDASIEKKIDAGGIILWVNVENDKELEKAIETLSKYDATDIHSHEI
jgi:hypothetical protein